MQIDKDKFLFLYTNEYGGVYDDQRLGLETILDFFSADEYMTDLRWIADGLATVKHECDDTWHPIEEYGKGKGLAYGKPDATTGKAYYGRGYVQLTWADNYKTMSKIVNHDLYQDPEAALTPSIAYKIMSHGMRHGMFTGVGLSKYINADKCDYINARRIINGLDCAGKIAAYAAAFEKMLNESIVEVA